MEDNKKIAEAKAREVMEQYHRESKKICEKYANSPGFDNGAKEQKALTEKTFNKIQALKREYNIF